jgi:hypothetical protein
MIAADLEDINNNKSNNSNGDNQEKRTVGEELFLVHLNRASAVEPDPTDFDRETKATEGAVSPTAKTKAKSKQKGAKKSDDQDLPTPGEELWKVHCKRFKGSDDGEDDVDADAKLEGVKGASGLIGGGGSVAHDDGRVLHLRNRDVAIH